MDEKLISLIKNGGVAVIPTDTIYGVVGSALNPKTVERIYRLRKRAADKQMIILISSLNDLNHFNIQLTKKQIKFFKKIWPNPVSVVLFCPDDKFSYLHRGVKTLAFRMPKNDQLLNLLKKVGPLVAPSANFEGEKPSENIDQAKKYFGDRIDFYIDGGSIKSNPSTLVEFEKDSLKILRQGNFQLTTGT